MKLLCVCVIMVFVECTRKNKECCVGILSFKLPPSQMPNAILSLQLKHKTIEFFFFIESQMHI